MARYGADDHKKAFEVWLETRNMSAVRRALEVEGKQPAYQTAYSWATPEFMCPDGCPYHNWDKLISDRERAALAQAACIVRGDYSPVSQEMAMVKAVEAGGETSKDRILAVTSLVRSSRERIGMWEYIWAKIAQDLTGFAVDPNLLLKKDLTNSEEAILSSLLNRGLHCTNMEQAVRTLAIVEDRIKEHSEALGLNGAKKDEDEKKDTSQLTLDEVRRVLALVEKDPGALKRMALVPAQASGG